MHLFPAIDMRGGRVVRLHQGDYDQETAYGDDPVGQALAFERAGASWLHLVDLDGARTGAMHHLEVVAAVCAQTSLHVQVGGGIRDKATIDRLLDAGVRRVILGTAALRDWAWFAGLLEQDRYRDRLVLGLDARGGKLAVSGWEDQLEASAVEVAAKVSGSSLSAIVYTDIAFDGTMEGPNVAATVEIAQATDVAVIASGGVGSLEHLHEIKVLALQGVIVGKAIYERAFTVEQAIQVLEAEA